MEGKEAIINKILEDAENSVQEILLTAKKEVDALISSANAWAEEYTQTQASALKKETAEIIERRLTVAELDVRKLTLKAKQDLIDDAFTMALEKLRSLGKTYYSRLVLKLLEENADEGDVIVLSRDGVLSEKDFLELKVFASKGLKVSEKRGDFLGGIKLIGISSDKDLTFETLIANIKEEKTSEVASLLF